MLKYCLRLLTVKISSRLLDVLLKARVRIIEIYNLLEVPFVRPSILSAAAHERMGFFYNIGAFSSVLRHLRTSSLLRSS